MKTRTLALWLLPFVFVLAGCSSAGGGNPLNAIFGRQAAAKQATQAKADAGEDAAVQAAQVEVVKTGVALAAAEKENPESRPVAVAKRTNANAAALLNQRRPLTVAELQDAITTVKGLLSENVEVRKAAEAKQGTTEKDNRALSEELGKLREKIETLTAKADAEARANLATANKLRWSNIWAAVSTVGTVAFGVGMLLYRANAFGMATRVAGGFVDLEKKHGAETADLARQFFDSALDSGDKNKVFAALSKIAPHIATRVSNS